ncbi:hypothetical protein [Kribbella sp. NPDC006257]|uniref:hypothetical protein n=1 Tax=Kribbella sp. NPDC006257 TaxID=3156738 RepID=UPI0033A0D4DD
MNVSDQDLTSAELAALNRAMEVVDRLPREAVDRVVRHLLRVGLYFRRTRNPEVLSAAVDSLFHMVKKNSDDTYRKRSSDAPHRDRREQSMDAQQVLAELRK